MKGKIPEGNFIMYVKTLYGLEEVLAEELRSLGAMRVESGVRMVSFYGDKGFMYKANLCLRTALNILVPVLRERVYNEKTLYKSVHNFPWERYLTARDTFVVDAVVTKSEVFTHSQYIALKVKDAIVDRIREKMNARPSIDKLHPTLRINVHINGNDLTLSFDSSGESLHKRGYRTATNIAPINEVLAAGLVKLAGWEGQTHLLDPMCGSGTILIEAAMIAANIPAGINRREFGFEKWRDFDAQLFEKMRDNALKRVRDPHFKIMGSDKAPSAVAKARENIKAAGLEEFIRVERGDFFESKRPEGSLTLIFNPPYGERLVNFDPPSFYKGIGDKLKADYPDTTVWMITAAIEDGLKNVGLRTSRRIPLMNANLETRFVKYELYEGSKKHRGEENATEKAS